MLTLLNPTALLALTGLLLPVAIHLWNRRPGREVAVGSLRWLAAGANRRLRSLKPEQLWLLLLRAALVAVLAVAVAGPGWRTVRPASRGVVLLSAEAAGLPALASLKPTIDSLRRKGYALRWLAAGFLPVPGGMWRKLNPGQPRATADSVAASATDGVPEFAWARVQQAAAIFPSQPIFVVTGSALRDFQGSHAPLPATVTWQALPDAKATDWLAAAAQRGDSLRLMLGRSSESQTQFRTLTVATPRPGARLRVAGLPPLRLRQQAADQQPSLVSAAPGTAADTAAAAVPVQTRPLQIIIYATTAYRSDARVLQAGLRAASVGLPVALALRITAQVPNPAAPPDWLFWLSDAPVPAAWQQAVRRGTGLWQEAPGPGVADTAYLATNTPENAPVAVLRRDNTAPSNGSVATWTDSRGRAILLRQPLGRGASYHLTTRLNSAWSDLAEAPQLPAWLLELLQPAMPAPTQGRPADAARLRHDQRAIDPTQLLVRQSPAMATGPPEAMPRPPNYGGFRTTDLRPWLVLLAGLLLLLERLLAHRRATLISPATG